MFNSSLNSIRGRTFSIVLTAALLSTKLFAGQLPTQKDIPAAQCQPPSLIAALMFEAPSLDGGTGAIPKKMGEGDVGGGLLRIMGESSRLGHAAVYFSDLCKESKSFKVRLCTPDDKPRGVVITFSPGLTGSLGVVKAAIPINTYLYGADKTVYGSRLQKNNTDDVNKLFDEAVQGEHAQRGTEGATDMNRATTGMLQARDIFPFYFGDKVDAAKCQDSVMRTNMQDIQKEYMNFFNQGLQAGSDKADKTSYKAFLDNCSNDLASTMNWIFGRMNEKSLGRKSGQGAPSIKKGMSDFYVFANPRQVASELYRVCKSRPDFFCTVERWAQMPGSWEYSRPPCRPLGMILNCSPVGFGLFAGSVLATGGVAAVLPWEIAFVGWLTRGHSLKSAVKDLGSTGLMNIRGIIREFEVKEKEICRDKSRAEDCKLIRQSIQNQKRAESDLKNYEQQQAKRNWEEYDEYYYDLITTLNSEDIFTPEVKSLFPVSQNKFKPGFGKNVFSALLKNPSTTLQRTNGSVQSATIILNGKTRTIGLTSQTAIGRDEDPELAFVMALSAVDEFMTRHKSEYTSLLQFAPYLERMSLALKAYLATLPESHALRSELEILANDAHDMILRLNPNPYAENAKISEREVASKRTRHYQKTTSKKKAH